MQTTLLGLAIAAILALVAALVGPAYVDWSQYRAHFEAEASRVAGQPVRIGGAIDVRLLPTPKITLRDVEVGPRAAPAFGAQAVYAELALGSLMRGELRASALRLTGPEIGFALDGAGRVAAPVRTVGIDLERIAIDRLVIEDGRISFDDAASGGRLLLGKFGFAGEVRAQTGQIRGEGEFAADGHPFRYRIATGRRDAGTRVRLTLDPADRALVFETDGNLTFDANSPVFEGTASIARPAGTVLEDGRTVAGDPWRIAGKVRADAHRALFEQVEAHYGPEERSLRLGGTGEFRFGAHPGLEGILSARQLDLDRVLSAANSDSRLPLKVLAELVDTLGGAGKLPFPLSFGIAADNITLGGASVQSVRADIKSVDGAWSIDTFEFRAPGATQVQFSGRLGVGAIAGPLSIDSVDPGVLMTWLEGADRLRDNLGQLRLRGDIDVGRERLALENVKAEIDRKAFEGRFAYTYPAGDRRAQLDVALTAAEFDVEAAYAFVKTALAGSRLERPGEVALAIDLGRTSFAGVAATGAKANLRYDAGGLRVERLSVADFGGATVSASGQIDVAAAQPAGNISLNLVAPKIDSVAAALEKFLPGTGEILSRHAAQLSPARIDAVLSLDPALAPQAASGDRPATGKFSLDGRLGNMRIALSGNAAGTLAELEKGRVRVEGRVVSDDGGLLAVLGLDRIAPAGRRPVSLTLAADGPLDGDLRVDAKFAGEGFGLTGTGVLKFADWTPAGSLDMTFTSADVVALRRAGATAFPAAVKARLKVAGGALDFTAIEGKAGVSNLKGQVALAVAHKQPWHIDGKIAADSLDMPSVLGAVLGAPPPVAALGQQGPGPQIAGQQVSWPSQPFSETFYSGLRGRVEFEAARASILPGIAAQKMRGVVALGGSQVSLENLTANVGNGAAAANVIFEYGPGGVTLRGRASLAPADAAAVIRAGARAPVAGRVSGELEFESVGSSPAALVAGLRGAGSMTLSDAKIVGLDAKAVDAAARAVERGMPIAPPRITEIVNRALDNGVLAVASATAPIELTNGRARLGKTIAPNASDVAIGGSLDLVEEAVDLRFTLFGSGAADAQGLQPELIVTVKGPLSAPRRSIDISTLTSWLTLQSVERESRKLEAEEREAKRRAALEALVREAMREPAVAAPPPSAPAVVSEDDVAVAPGPVAPVAPVSPVPPVATPRPPATGMFAPELPAPQIVPAMPRPGASAALPQATNLLPPAPAPSESAPAGSIAVPGNPASAQASPGMNALPLNPPLPPRRPPVTARGPVELNPPPDHGPRFDVWRLFR